jgi:hypothetical protein
MRVGLFLLCMLAALFGLSAAMSVAHAVGFDPPSTPAGQPLLVEKLVAALYSAALGLLTVAYIYRAGGKEVRK